MGDLTTCPKHQQSDVNETRPMDLSFPDPAEMSADQLRHLTELQQNILVASASSGSAKERIDEIRETLSAAVPGHIATVMIINSAGKLQFLSAPDALIPSLQKLNELEPGPTAGSCANAVYSGQSIYVENALKDQRWQDVKEVASANRIRACWSVPVVGDGDKILGTFALTSRKPGLPTAWEAQVLALGAVAMQPLLKQLADAHSLASHQAEIRRLSDFNNLFASVSELASTSRSELDLLQAICEQAIAHIGLKLAWIGHPDATGQFTILAAAGDAIGYLDSIKLSVNAGCPEGQGPAGRTWREARSIFNTSFEGEAFLGPWRDRANHFGIASNATLPIQRGGRIWGVFAAYNDRDHAFDAHLQTVLEILATGIARGLDRFDADHHHRRTRDGLTLLAKALSSVQEGVMITDAGQHILYVNQAFERLTGYSAGEIKGKTGHFLQGPETDPEVILQIREAVRTNRSFSGEILNYRKDGSEFWNLLTINPIRQSGRIPTHFVGIQRDITHLRSLNAQLEYQSLHDALTGLPNRRALESHLEHAINQADRGGRIVAVGIVDVDDFKQVNDSLNPSSGDVVLKTLGQRFAGTLQPTEYLARTGGDEFVFVLEHLEIDHIEPELDAFAARLQDVVEKPFSTPKGAEVHLGISMGLALYPRHARDSGLLLRLADSALYQIKQQKGDRSSWWTLYEANPQSSAETADQLDPYGPLATKILADIEPQLVKVAAGIIDQFQESETQDPALNAVLKRLPETELDRFKSLLSNHLCLVMGSTVSREALESSSRNLGQVYALTGVDTIMLMRILAFYRQLLSNFLNRQPLMARKRYQILQVAEQRLLDDIQGQLSAQAKIHSDYVEYTLRPLPERLGTWSDALAHEIGFLGELPGILGALLIRLSSRGVFKIEASAGKQAQGIARVLRLSGIETNSTSLLPSEGSRMFRAWHTGTIQTVPTLPSHNQDPLWADFFRRLKELGVISFAHIPVLNELGQSIALLTLNGAFPNQFESTGFRQFSRNLQHRWSEIWLRSSLPPMAVSKDQSIAYRQRLFGGGLQMYMQPIVDMRTGALFKAEALARLVTTDGKVLGPGTFLPLLGDAELDRLFRQGLEQLLRQVNHWQTEGLSVAVTINLPPRTLLDPDCPIWINEALLRHQVSADRLTLELLESQKIDEAAKVAALARLRDLGVKLAMDDLGSGFSSLHRLASAHFDAIKVDQGLLARIRVEPLQTLSLISTIIQMGADFGCDVIVEGLEDQGMIEAGRILGGHYGQGYALARPMPADSVPNWAKTFSLPSESNKITTALGALTYHWKTMRQGHTHPCSLDECPLTQFLVEQGLETSEAAQFHIQIHTLSDQKSASQELLEALTAMVLEQKD